MAAQKLISKKDNQMTSTRAEQELEYKCRLQQEFVNFNRILGGAGVNCFMLNRREIGQQIIVTNHVQLFKNKRGGIRSKYQSIDT